MINAAYIIASALFILSLGGLSHQEKARRGSVYGIFGMLIAVVATLFADSVANYEWIILFVVIGGAAGVAVAARIQMAAIPQLVAILHSFVGLAAVLVGFATRLDASIHRGGVERVILEIEIYIAVLIGALTFAGSVVAFGKLQGLIRSTPAIVPMRHALNLAIVGACVYLGMVFVGAATVSDGVTVLLAMTVLAMILGAHAVAAIGGADMPVVISMLNSYSGWAAAATGFMLSNDLLIVTGALVGSSGAILAYIMCRAMNRRFINVILGGFGTGSSKTAAVKAAGTVVTISAAAVTEVLNAAQSLIIVPGYGMAVAQAQYAIAELTRRLDAKNINVRFAIHPIAGRMPGHMNVLLAEAKVPYDIVLEMDEINAGLQHTDVVVVIGANDIVNPSALDTPDSPIAGMPVIKVWNARTVIVLKRSMAYGYSGVENPLFFRANTRMLFGDAKDSIEQVLNGLD